MLSNHHITNYLSEMKWSSRTKTCAPTCMRTHIYTNDMEIGTKHMLNLSMQTHEFPWVVDNTIHNK